MTNKSKELNKFKINAYKQNIEWLDERIKECEDKKLTAEKSIDILNDIKKSIQREIGDIK